MIHICVYMSSRFIENHLIWILEDRLLISEVVLSHFDTHDFFYREAQCSSVTKNSRRHPMRLRRYILYLNYHPSRHRHYYISSCQRGDFLKF
jgi:hypothetical protein